MHNIWIRLISIKHLPYNKCDILLRIVCRFVRIANFQSSKHTRQLSSKHFYYQPEDSPLGSIYLLLQSRRAILHPISFMNFKDVWFFKEANDTRSSIMMDLNFNDISNLTHIIHIKIREKKSFVSYNIIKLLVTRRISSTYKTKIMNLLSLPLRYIHWSIIFSMNLKFKIILLNFLYH